MGTRSLTFVYEDQDESKKRPVKIMCLYGQYDGYPSGHGLELSKFLLSGEMVNGIPFGVKKKMFNGMGCLAAQMVAEFKKEAGDFYIYSPSTKNVWQEYEYHVYPNKVVIKDINQNKNIFSGSWHDFYSFCEKAKD